MARRFAISVWTLILAIVLVIFRPIGVPEVLQSHGWYDSAEPKIELADGWTYNPEVANFFLVPAFGYIKDTSRLEISQVGLGCSSKEHTLEQINTSTQWNSKVESVKVAGKKATRIETTDDPRVTQWRQFFGDADVYEVEFYLKHGCYLWRIDFMTEVANKDMSVPEFEAMLASLKIKG